MWHQSSSLYSGANFPPLLKRFSLNTLLNVPWITRFFSLWMKRLQTILTPWVNSEMAIANHFWWFFPLSLGGFFTFMCWSVVSCRFGSGETLYSLLESFPSVKGFLQCSALYSSWPGLPVVPTFSPKSGRQSSSCLGPPYLHCSLEIFLRQ